MKRDVETLYARKADILKALAHPLRLAVVEYLGGRERCVCEIADDLGCGRSNLSRHLSLMVRAGVLSNRKEGLNVYYRPRCRCVLDFTACVNGVIREQVKEARRLLGK